MSDRRERTSRLGREMGGGGRSSLVGHGNSAVLFAVAIAMTVVDVFVAAAVRSLQLKLRPR